MITGLCYTAVWFLLAAYLIFVTVKRYRTPIMYLLCGFMVFLGIWELINALNDINMKAGVYGWVYRGVALAVLVLCLVWYFVLRHKN